MNMIKRINNGYQFKNKIVLIITIHDQGMAHIDHGEKLPGHSINRSTSKLLNCTICFGDSCVFRRDRYTPIFSASKLKQKSIVFET